MRLVTRAVARAFFVLQEFDDKPRRHRDQGQAQWPMRCGRPPRHSPERVQRQRTERHGQKVRPEPEHDVPSRKRHVIRGAGSAMRLFVSKIGQIRSIMQVRPDPRGDWCPPVDDTGYS